MVSLSGKPTDREQLAFTFLIVFKTEKLNSSMGSVLKQHLIARTVSISDVNKRRWTCICPLLSVRSVYFTLKERRPGKVIYKYSVYPTDSKQDACQQGILVGGINRIDLPLNPFVIQKKKLSVSESGFKRDFYTRVVKDSPKRIKTSTCYSFGGLLEFFTKILESSSSCVRTLITTHCVESSHVVSQLHWHPLISNEKPLRWWT